MKAVVFNKKAKPGKLVYADVEKPVPGDDGVLVKVAAVSLNAADYRSMKLGIIPKKLIFGADVAGVVEAVGKDVSMFVPGDEVMGDLAGYGFGGLAEYVAAPEKAWIKKPPGLAFEKAAAIPLAAITALQALRDKGKIRKGQQVLIAGSSGGVGTYALQMAKYYGATVTAVCSTKNVEQSNSLGADRVIDYTKEDFTKEKVLYDLIFAVNGNKPLIAYRRMLAPHGIYVLVGGAMTLIFKSMLFGWLLSIGSRKMYFLSAKANQKDLQLVASLAAQGVVKPVIEKNYPFEQTAVAMNYVRQGHARGKVVITF